MRHPDIDMMMQMERRRDELAAAAHFRLVKEARLANQAEAGIVSRPIQVRWPVLALARLMSFLGEWMLHWSCRLQSRYQVLSGELIENGSSPCA